MWKLIVALLLCSAINFCQARKEAWAWVYRNWKLSSEIIVNNKNSFTHISPTFYTVNYNYVSGTPRYYNTAKNYFGGMTTKQFTAKLSAAKISVVPAIFGGSANFGIDIGVKNILNNNHNARTNFINYMVREAKINGYAGYNIDWEINITNTKIKGPAYVAKFVNFLKEFKSALGYRLLTVDAIDSNLAGTYCSGNNGFINIAQIINHVDRVIVNDYSNYIGNRPLSCASSMLSIANPSDCSAIYDGEKRSFTKFLNVMRCNKFTPNKLVIGMQADHINNNPIANACIARLKSYGFYKIAIWPQQDGNDPYISDIGMHSGSNWYKILHRFLHT